MISKLNYYVYFTLLYETKSLLVMRVIESKRNQMSNVIYRKLTI